MLGSVGSLEILAILFVVLLLFGGNKLPEFARNLGKGLREFKRAAQGLDEEKKEDTPIDKNPQ